MVFPGEEEVMHKHDEYVKIDRLITASKIYAAIVAPRAQMRDSMKKCECGKTVQRSGTICRSND